VYVFDVIEVSNAESRVFEMRETAIRG